MLHFYSVFVVLDPPGPPSKPKVTDITRDSCKLSWRAPEENGGNPVIGYHVERTCCDVIRWFRVNQDVVQDVTYTATNLMEGTEYFFRISAVNAAATGPAGEKSDRILAKDPWGVKREFTTLKLKVFP